MEATPLVGAMPPAGATPPAGAIPPVGATSPAGAVPPVGAAPDPRDAEWMWEAEEIEVLNISFTLTPGPRNCPPTLTVLEAFSIIFPHSLLQHLVDDTNSYASQHQQHQQLTSITKEELCMYFAILLAMSMKTAPSMKDHWKGDSLLGTPASQQHCLTTALDSRSESLY